jgi:hypothetical protein
MRFNTLRLINLLLPLFILLLLLFLPLSTPLLSSCCCCSCCRHAVACRNHFFSCWSGRHQHNAHDMAYLACPHESDAAREKLELVRGPSIQSKHRLAIVVCCVLCVCVSVCLVQRQGWAFSAPRLAVPVAPCRGLAVARADFLCVAASACVLVLAFVLASLTCLVGNSAGPVRLAP